MGQIIINKIPLWWFKSIKGNNWGDALNPLLVQLISNKEVEYNLINNDNEKFLVIGSILDNANLTCNIWGSGFINRNGNVKSIPKNIYAVRGPLTKNRLIQLGIKCPEIYGDPALLYSIFYNPKVEQIYDLGIIPHYVDQNNEWLNNVKDLSNIKIINILDDINKVVNEIKSCKMIVSSSLHGIIAGDSYGIPSYWIKFSDAVLGAGFKFNDYFRSVNRNDTNPLIINNSSSISSVFNLYKPYKLDIDLDKLYNVCPFKNKN